MSGPWGAPAPLSPKGKPPKRWSFLRPLQLSISRSGSRPYLRVLPPPAARAGSRGHSSAAPGCAASVTACGRQHEPGIRGVSRVPKAASPPGSTVCSVRLPARPSIKLRGVLKARPCPRTDDFRPALLQQQQSAPPRGQMSTHASFWATTRT